MLADQTSGFTDNWAYLRTELNWLDRVLMVAVARQRKDAKELDRIAQTRADRVSHHWWQGMIALDGKAAYDDCHKPQKPAHDTPKVSYQQQLEAKIRASQACGVTLALPLLCDRLQLSVFEKNAVLMSLAPEVNRRYAHIYHFLQGDAPSVKTDLPTVDTVLRLLCRNDQEWRTARAQLISESPLLQLGLVQLRPLMADTLLSQSLKLKAELVDYLLAETPTPERLDALVDRPGVSRVPSYLVTQPVSTQWRDLIIPPTLLAALQALSRRLSLSLITESGNELSPFPRTKPLGTLALVVGRPGTGKTTAAQAIAYDLNLPLTRLDLAEVDPSLFEAVINDIVQQQPSILLIQSADQWLRRSSFLTPALLQHLFNQRRDRPTLTLFSVALQESVALQWQRQLDQTLLVPLPSASDRLLFWQRALPPSPELEKIDWPALARQLRLTGSDIEAIAHTAVLNQTTAGAPALTLHHLLEALTLHGHSLKCLPCLPAKRPHKRAGSTKPKTAIAPP